MINRRPYRRNRSLYASPVPKSVAKPKMKWRILPILWMAIKRTCTVLGAFVLISMTISLFTAVALVQQAAPALPDDMVLYLKFEGGLREVPSEANFADPFGKGEPTVKETVDAIDGAARDPRVHGIVARMNGGSFSLAHIQEIRTALKGFRESGKFAYIYSSSYGGSGPGLGRYYLASAFEEIWMQPLGIVSIGGINAEVPFFKSTLDKVGVSPQFYQRKEYKTAYESMTNETMSPQNREMMEQLIGDLKDQIVGDIANDLGKTPASFEQMVHKGLYTAQEAEAAGLISYADYADELVDIVKELVTGDPEAEDTLFVDARSYMADLQRNGLKGMMKGKADAAGKSKVALIYAVGAIMPSGAGGKSVAAADEIAPAIMDATDDPDVEAIVLRIDSPGGSPSASESILRAVEKAQEKNIPVIVSMGPTAASGGYWIAAYADQIFVLPTTITGSIGVVGGKFYLRDLWAKLGVNWETIKWGENAGMWSLNTPFSESEAERVNAMLDQVYDAFIARVARGRQMHPVKVDSLAKGRVWSGSRAVKLGLADQIGGLSEALDYTARLLDQKDRSQLDVVIMPKPKTRVEQFIELLGAQVALGQNMRWQKSLAAFAEPMLMQIEAAQNPELYTVYESLSVD